MNLCITGASGNLGSFLARHLLNTNHSLRLLIHHTKLPPDIARGANVSICRADLADPATLQHLLDDIDCVIHFAGVLFRPRPEKFLPV
jgi:nucleoside-diphosphate-sugar epimerase